MAEQIQLNKTVYGKITYPNVRITIINNVYIIC